MTTLKDCWDKNYGDSVDKDEFTDFFNSLGIQLDPDEANSVFHILDTNGGGKVTFKTIKVFLNMTKVYDVQKYPKKRIKRRKSSYKIVPE